MSEDLKRELTLVLKNGISYSEDRQLFVIDQSVYDWIDARMRNMQLCPKCLGEGIVPSWGSTTSTTRTCPVCKGAKLI